MKTLPALAKLIKYHAHHCAVVDPKNTFPHLLDAYQSYGQTHADAIKGIETIWPEDQCRAWLTSKGFIPTGYGDKHKTGELWKKTA